ncbi:MAG: TIGR04149 family rSAM-modified RiPP [Bacteroidia bacterium]|nr:TIGR04149 family rSAM-modified RiPP [Bacteroidia bacterium]
MNTNFNLSGATKLSKSEMKNVKGGAAFNCSCSGHAGTWSGNYRSVSQMIDAIERFCDGGGSCSAAR